MVDIQYGTVIQCLHSFFIYFVAKTNLLIGHLDQPIGDAQTSS